MTDLTALTPSRRQHAKLAFMACTYLGKAGNLQILRDLRDPKIVHRYQVWPEHCQNGSFAEPTADANERQIHADLG